MFTAARTLFLSLFFLCQRGLLYAQAQEEMMPPREQNFWQTLVMIGLVGAFFYFILWRPEQQRRKALERKRASLKKGDRVIAMGIIGTVLRLEEDTLILKMYDGSKIELLKGAVSEVLTDDKTEVNGERSKEHPAEEASVASQ